jgi:hypothetical protein
LARFGRGAFQCLRCEPTNPVIELNIFRLGHVHPPTNLGLREPGRATATKAPEEQESAAQAQHARPMAEMTA